ncbi:hypothetical protein [Sphingomonas colocasiae]|uniref:Uncharacterized protein n=1 Tax=Sphingomonas colocasiae TaxID=1848973 RepID=A0ABS7Q023_9SPHN|nr:hypothetical protein [Sphingomonas colocasiae]MBY8825599.1 hypothetical protein [Sphingomonas colocasiae]
MTPIQGDTQRIRPFGSFANAVDLISAGQHGKRDAIACEGAFARPAAIKENLPSRIFRVTNTAPPDCPTCLEQLPRLTRPMVDGEELNRRFVREVLPLERWLTVYIRRNWRVADDVLELRQDIYEHALLGADRGVFRRVEATREEGESQGPKSPAKQRDLWQRAIAWFDRDLKAGVQ